MFADLQYNCESGLFFFLFQKGCLSLPVFLFTQEVTLDPHFTKMYVHAYFNNNKGARIIAQQ